MIERTRRETFQSGFLFIVPGIIWLVAVIVMGTLEMTGRAAIVHSWGWTVFASIALTSIVIGFIEGRKVKNHPQTYTRYLFMHLWCACAVVIVLISFAVPHMNSYTAVAPLLIIGIGFYVTGVIYELPLVQLSGVIWWIGMCALGFIDGNVRLLIWIAIIFFGFILPGIVMNRQYRSQEAGHGE
jgi:hypothetical protein